MKIDAKIRWIIDDKDLGIVSGSEETVAVDADYVNSDFKEIVDWIQDELEKKYKTPLYFSSSENDEYDFVILNMNDLLDDLAMEEFNDKTELTINGPEM